MPEQDKDPKKTDEKERDVRDLAPEKDVKGGISRASGGGGGAAGGPPLNQE